MSVYWKCTAFQFNVTTLVNFAFIIIMEEPILTKHNVFPNGENNRIACLKVCFSYSVIV